MKAEDLVVGSLYVNSKYPHELFEYTGKSYIFIGEYSFNRVDSGKEYEGEGIVCDTTQLLKVTQYSGELF